MRKNLNQISQNVHAHFYYCFFNACWGELNLAERGGFIGLAGISLSFFYSMGFYVSIGFDVWGLITLDLSGIFFSGVIWIRGYSEWI